jgi:hypothetical protein
MAQPPFAARVSAAASMSCVLSVSRWRLPHHNPAYTYGPTLPTTAAPRSAARPSWLRPGLQAWCATPLCWVQAAAAGRVARQQRAANGYLFAHSLPLHVFLTTTLKLHTYMHSHARALTHMHTHTHTHAHTRTHTHAMHNTHQHAPTNAHPHAQCSTTCARAPHPARCCTSLQTSRRGRP